MPTETFTDFDAFAGALRDVDGSLMLTHVLERKWVYTYRAVGRLDIACGHAGSGALFRGTARHPGCLFCIDATNPPAFAFNGARVGSACLAVLGSRAEAYIASQRRSDWLTVFVPQDVLIAHAAQYGFDAEVLLSSFSVITPAPGTIARLRQIVGRLAVDDRDTPWILDDPQVGAAAASELLIAALDCLAPAAPYPGLADNTHSRRQASHAKLVHDAVERLEAGTADDHVQVGDVAEAVAVSERTLRNAFSEYTGVSPARYMKLRRLHRVHHALRNATPAENTVTQLESRFGVWEFGRFAREYRELFGELPSETLAKGPRV